MKRRQLLLGGWIAIGLGLVLGALVVSDDEDTDNQSATTTTTTPDGTETTTARSDAPTTNSPATTSTLAATTTSTLAPDLRPLPGDPVALGAALSEAETAVRSTVLSDEERSAWGRRQQRLYRLLSANPEWEQNALAAVSDQQRAAVERNWSARQSLSSLVNSVALSDTLPAWRIREPLPALDLLDLYQAAAEATGVPWEYLAAINLIETRMGRIEGLSTAGAVGPMQFLPSTWNECCEGDPTLDEDAILGAAVYLTIRGAPDDMTAAVRGYNNSEQYVAAVEAYAEVMAEDDAAYHGYHAWEVYFLSSAGLLRLPAGYDEPEPVDAAQWAAENPDALRG